MNKLSSVLGGAAVIAIAAVFILQFRPASGVTKTDSGPVCVAEVRGHCLSTGSFWASYRLIAGNIDQSRVKGLNLRRHIADGLVEQWLLNQDAKRLGITVSDDEVRAELAQGRTRVSLPAADIARLGYQLGLGDGMVRPIQVKALKPINGKKVRVFERKTYEKEVRRVTHLSPEEFLEYQRAELTAARMRDLIRSRVHVGETEAFDQFSRDKSTATIDYIRFDRRFFADLVVDVSPKAVASWALEHKDEIDKVWDSRKAQLPGECRAVREIFVKLGEAATDDDKVAANRKAERARERIRSGEDFATVAKGVSDDPSATHGGEMGCLLKGRAPKPVEDAVMALEAGKVSDVIPTENGFFVVKVDQIEKGEAGEKLARDFVARELFIAHESDRLAASTAKNVLAAAKGGKTLKDALDAYLTELAASVKPVAETKAKDKKKAKDGKQAEQPKDADRPALTVQNHPNRPTVETTLPFNEAGDPISGARENTEVTKAAFALQKPGDIAGELVNLENGFAVIALKEKTPATKEQWAKDREFYMGSLRAYKADDALVAYMKNLWARHATEVKYTTQLLTESKAAEQPSGPAEDDSGEF